MCFVRNDSVILSTYGLKWAIVILMVTVLTTACSQKKVTTPPPEAADETNIVEPAPLAVADPKLLEDIDTSVLEEGLIEDALNGSGQAEDENNVMRIFDQGVEALKNDDLKKAEKHFVYLIIRYPQYASPYANLSLIYERKGKIKEAQSVISRAIDLHPDNPKLRNQLALILRKRGFFEEAKDQYTQALKTDPSYAKAHLNLGILYDIYLRNMGAALYHYQKFLTLTPQEENKTVRLWVKDLQQRIRKTHAIVN